MTMQNHLGNFLEWTKAGVFLALWKRGLTHYDEAKGIDWSWLSIQSKHVLTWDGAVTKAPLGGGEVQEPILQIEANWE